jgi:light-independent protochlorophyllide reductase subunit B
MKAHLLEIFRGHDTKEVITKGISTNSDLNWNQAAQAKLNQIPSFVRDKVKCNTEQFAREHKFSTITLELEVMYSSKESVEV